MEINKWGWSPFFEVENEKLQSMGLVPGRIIKENRNIYEIITNSGKFTSKVSGSFLYKATSKSDFPTIGDWVGVKIDNNIAVIECLLKRKSAFSRKSAGDISEEQIIAANIDHIFLVFALDGGRNYTPGAVERFLTRAWDSGANPIIILNKSDLCSNSHDFVIETELLAPGVPIILSSTINGDGLQEIKQYITSGETIGFTGFSGVGKSALINALSSSEIMKTGEVRTGDHKGKHTTTHKELILLPNGGILIDSPGLKELQLWGDESSLEDTFSDIAELALHCKFRDCTHSGEPGCAVTDAISMGNLNERRLHNYNNMKKELRYTEARSKMSANAVEREKWKPVAKIIKKITK